MEERLENPWISVVKNHRYHDVEILPSVRRSPIYNLRIYARQSYA